MEVEVELEVEVDVWTLAGAVVRKVSTTMGEEGRGLNVSGRP